MFFWIIQGQSASTEEKKKPSQLAPPPPPSSNYYSYLRCWRCDYDDPEQCVKNFDFTKHKHEACDGKCLKAFEKVEARTKVEIDKANCNFVIYLFKCILILKSNIYLFFQIKNSNAHN